MIREQYPTGRQVFYEYNNAGQLVLVCKGPCGNGDYYIQGFAYTQYGLPNYMGLGNGVLQSWWYTSQLQPGMTQAIPLGSPIGFTLINDYNPGANNGNVVSQTYNGMTVWGTHNYTYDGLNRLTQDTSSSWSESYAYDRFGNRAVTGRVNLPGLTGETPNNVNWYNAANNRVNTFTYDARGNVTAVPGRTMGYDGENRQAWMTRNGVTHQYYYDADQERTINFVDATHWTVYVYDAFGRLAEEYSPVTGTVEHIYGLGHVATETSAGRRYYANDQLGSTRLTTDASGTIIGVHDYLPFGEEVGVGCGTLPSAVKWTGQYRDQESCLDYFVNRYVSPAMGRFTSPDRPFADQHVGDPQSWNLYSYGRNNPLNYTDPTGECIITGGTTKDTYCGGSVTVTASPDVTPIDPFWNECFGPAAAYSMRCFGAYLEPGMVIVNTDPGDGGGGGGGQPPQPKAPKFTDIKTDVGSCASHAAGHVSMGAGLNALGIGSNGGAAGFVVDALGGNDFAGIVDLVRSIRSGAGGGHNLFYNFGQAVASGSTQGFGPLLQKAGVPTGSPILKGATDFATDGLVKAAYGAGRALPPSALSPLKFTLGFSTTRAASLATGVGEAKFLWDGLTYLGAVAGCGMGVLQ